MSMCDRDMNITRWLERQLDEPRYDSGGFEVLSPADEINERLGYDADVTDRSQYCSTCGQFIGSPGGPDILCRCG